MCSQTHIHKLYVCRHRYLASTATGGVDYTSGGYEVTFPAGSSTAELTINITNDNMSEPTKRFRARLSVSQSVSDLGVSVGSDDTATINIEDNDGECMDMAQASILFIFYISERIVQTGYRLCIY